MLTLRRLEIEGFGPYADRTVLEFPVEVEIRIIPACDPDDHVDATLAQLTAALEALT